MGILHLKKKKRSSPSFAVCSSCIFYINVFLQRMQEWQNILNMMFLLQSNCAHRDYNFKLQPRTSKQLTSSTWAWVCCSLRLLLVLGGPAGGPAGAPSAPGAPGAPGAPAGGAASGADLKKRNDESFVSERVGGGNISHPTMDNCFWKDSKRSWAGKMLCVKTCESRGSRMKPPHSKEEAEMWGEENRGEKRGSNEPASDERGNKRLYVGHRKVWMSNENIF